MGSQRGRHFLLAWSLVSVLLISFVPAWSGCGEYLANVPPPPHSETRADIANQSQHSFLLSAEMVLGYWGPSQYNTWGSHYYLVKISLRDESHMPFSVLEDPLLPQHADMDVPCKWMFLECLVVGWLCRFWAVKKCEVDALPIGRIHSHWGGCTCEKVNACTLVLIITRTGPQSEELC